jgi:hypothetical protein
MTEAEFKSSMKTEPGLYNYVIVDAEGNTLKQGVASDPIGRFNDYVTKEGLRNAQMRVHQAKPNFEARSTETAGIASELEQGRETMNVRTDTRTELKEGELWADDLHPASEPSGPPLITIRRY